MTFLGPLSRAAALAGLLLSSSFAAAPAFAGPAEVSLLKSYIGEWRGRGTLVGAATETVVCRLSLSQGNQDKINYSAAARWRAPTFRLPAPLPMSTPRSATKQP